MDVMIVIVILMVTVIFLVIQQTEVTKENNVDEIEEQASKDQQKIVDELKRRDVISAEREVDMGKLTSIDHQQLKRELGIKGDFAIAFEKDNNLVKINPEENITCVGTGKISVNGQDCQ